MSALRAYLETLIDALDVPAVDDEARRVREDRLRTVLTCLRHLTAGQVRVADLPGDMAILRDMLARTDDRVAALRAEQDRRDAEWSAKVQALPNDLVATATQVVQEAGFWPLDWAMDAWEPLQRELATDRRTAMLLADRLVTDRGEQS